MTLAGIQSKTPSGVIGEEECHHEQGSTELLSHTETIGELTLSISLYRLILGGRTFYAVSSADLRSGNEAAAAIVGCDEETAKDIYARIVRGSVPPSTLREIVFDLTDDL